MVALFCTPLNTYAATLIQNINEEIIQNSDGTYIVIDTEIGESYALRDGRSTRSASKTYTYRSYSGSTLWTFTLRGTFSYNGSSSSAQNASATYSIRDYSWSCDDYSSYCSGDTAYGSAYFSSPTVSEIADVSLNM